MLARSCKTAAVVGIHVFFMTTPSVVAPIRRKSEIRISKLETSTKHECPKRFGHWYFGNSDLFRISDFVLRIYGVISIPGLFLSSRGRGALQGSLRRPLR